MPPHHVNADVKVRNRVPQGSRSHFGEAKIGVAGAVKGRTYSVSGETTSGRAQADTTNGLARTDRGLRSIVVLHADDATINRRSPLRIPPMLKAGIGGPYRREIYVAAI